jgi:glycosyltransferase involved in cell wall biosynthesis
MTRPRLLIVPGGPGGREDGTVVVPSRTSRLFAGYREYFATTLCLRGPAPGDGVPLPPEIEALFIPPYEHFPGYLRRRHATRRRLRDGIRRAHLLLARLPAFEAVDALDIARSEGVRSVALVVGRWAPAVRETIPPIRWALRRMARTLTTGAVRRADLTLTQGTHLARDMSAAGLSATAVIQGNLATDDFDELAPRFRLGNGVIRVVTTARMVPTKNLQGLIRAVGQLVSEGHAVSLTLIGDGSARPGLESLTTELGLRDRVRFAGWIDSRDAIREVYRASDVFVLPSLEEGISTAVMEAMAAGLPVVVASAEGITDIVRHGHNGLVTPPHPLAIAERIKGLAGDPVTADRLARQAQEDAGAYLHARWVATFARIAERLVPWPGLVSETDGPIRS